jgi:predicted AAA+ superfamily ATPase
MGIASSLVNVADKVISKFGGDVTIRFVAAGAYNTSDGTVAETNTDSEVKGILEDVVSREANELVQAGDKRLTVAAKDLDSVPGTKDKVVISTVVHQIISVKTNEQENTAITYELILRA